MKPSVNRGMGLLVTNLFALPRQPNRGTFNQQQFAEWNKRRPLRVFVPRSSRWPVGRGASIIVQSVGFETGKVQCFDVWHPPLIGRWLNARLLARRMKQLIDDQRLQPRFVLGSFAYPDGVAAVLLARQMRVPGFIKVHGSDLNVMAADRFIGPQVRWAMRQAAGVIVVSRALQGKVDELGFAPRRLQVVYNGIDRVRFQPGDRQQARLERALPAQRRSILYIGNLKPDKGVLDLLEAFAKIAGQWPAVDLEYVGAGAAEAGLRERALQCGLSARVRLHDARPHEEMPSWLRACDLLCLPSHAEGVPNVVLEAQAAGRPVVATSVGGIPEVLGEDGGVLVAPRNPESLAQALTQVLQQSWDPAHVAAACRVGSWADSAAAMEDFIGGALAQEAGS